MTEYEKTAEDVQWIQMDIPGRGTQRVCSISDARLFFNVSGTQLQTILNEHNITRYETGRGRTKYVCEVDLEAVKQERMAVRSAGARISPKQLLAEAAALFQQLAGSHEDTEEAEAIAKWLEIYQKIKD